MDFRELMAVAVENKEKAKSKKKMGFRTDFSGAAKKIADKKSKGINSESVRKFLEKQEHQEKSSLSAKKRARSASTASEQADVEPDGIEDLFKTRSCRKAHDPTVKQLTNDQKKMMQEKLNRVKMGIQGNNMDLKFCSTELADKSISEKKRKNDAYEKNIKIKTSDNTQTYEESSSKKLKKKKHKHDKDREKNKHKHDNKDCKSVTNISKTDIKSNQSKDKKSEKPKKKVQRPPPPSMNFQDLLKIAEKKQFEPIMIEKKVKEVDKRPMTQEEKDRLEYRKSKEYKMWYKTGKMPQKPTDTVENTKKRSNNDTGKTSSQQTVKASASDKQSMPERVKEKQGPDKQKNVSSVKSKTGKNPVPLNPYMDSRDSKTFTKTKSASDISGKQQIFDETHESVLVCGPPPSKKTKQERPAVYNGKGGQGDSEESPWDRICKNFTKAHSRNERQNRRIESDDEDEYDDDLDDFIASDEDDIGYGYSGGGGYSSVIKEIFGYDKSKYRDVDDDVDNMETGFADQMVEERRSAKIGKMEDIEDIRREEQHKKQKMMLKKQQLKKRR